MIYPPLFINFHLPPIQVETEEGKVVDLQSLIQNPKAPHLTLVIPGFTRCQGTCPLMVQTYKKLLQAEGHRSISVIFFSFNPVETLEELRTFHTAQGAPASWHFMRADGKNTQLFLDSLQITTMKVGDSFDHPVQVFGFSSDATWIGSLYGFDVTESEVEQMYAKAQMQATSPLLYTVVSRLKNPNTLAIYGGIGCVFSLVVLFYYLYAGRRKVI
jgi:cytochrome oxidase Cu insertion factor (SCO1/SenC/PrrC family)